MDDTATHATAAPRSAHIPQDELERRVMFAALTLPARLLHRTSLSIRDVSQLTEIATFNESRRRGLRMKDIEKVMSIKIAKAALVSKELKRFFAMPGSAHGLPRRILSLLWSQPLTQHHLQKALAEEFEADEVDEALEALLEQGRVREVPGRTTRYSASARHYSFVEDGWLSRVQALQSFMTSVSQAVEARFFDQDERAFVRTLQLRVTDADLPRLREFYQQEWMPLLRELSERGDEDPESTPVRVSIHWGPDSDSEPTGVS